MKKFLIFIYLFLFCTDGVIAAVRDERATIRQGSPTQSVKTISANSDNGRITASRNKGTVLTPRAAKTTARTAATRTTTYGRTSTSDARTVNPRTGTAVTQNISARAATNIALSETRTGAQYEQCKTAYFTCMDQFCALKNDDYRRCSCSNRVLELAASRDVIQETSEQLTVFNENLEVVGMTSGQATAMKTASDGETALANDSSASKALLEAIMNSIRGKDTTVGGKYTDLNSINLSFDTINAFSGTSSGQAASTNNGQNLYNAVYPQCRSAVRADCNDASLQRAINAYLMAIEQDCNTVQTSLEEKQKQIKSAVRESSAMLDLARIENRQKHNSDSLSDCIANVEQAIQSEEVCGKNYRKCLDNGEFIDVSTGAPIAGVESFYELETLLTFADGVESYAQKLSQVASNRNFVQNFENRVKKFATPALDKCTEQADDVWAEYLDKALLDIYYAQKSKVAEIKQGCFDFIATCYTNTDTALTAAMQALTGEDLDLLQPAKIALTEQMCTDYINSCNYMFDDNLIAEYLSTRQDADTLTACRAITKQCFDNFGGSAYENFYYPYSGVFNTTMAPDWFTLYEITGDEQTRTYKSECAKQLAEIDGCKDPDMIEKVFGGFDAMLTDANFEYNNGNLYRYGLLNGTRLSHRTLRPTGVATEIYNQIIGTLSTQCSNIQGRFVEYQFIKSDLYSSNNFCISIMNANTLDPNLYDIYQIGTGENMCPRDYSLNIDTQSWGACLCWENGGRRSKWGKSASCLAALPVSTQANDSNCSGYTAARPTQNSSASWCTQSSISSSNQVCPIGATINEDGFCVYNGTILTNIPSGLR